MAVCRCQNANFGEIVLISSLAEVDREFAEDSRVEDVAELFTGQAKSLYRIDGQLSISNAK